jgi:ATP/maltotriose-dependent transcriptional regulator MalT
MVSGGDGFGRGREQFERQSWGQAYAFLRAVDGEGPVEAADLERLAIAAYMTGHDEAACDAWSRAHRAYVGEGDALAAVRCAVWLGIVLPLLGQEAHGRGWFARARTVSSTADSADQSLVAGYAEATTGLEALFGGDSDVARQRLDSAARIAQRSGDADLVALGRLGCGQALLRTGQIADGMVMLDEAMIAVSGGEVSPVAAGLIYCAVIDSCQEVFDLRRAQEWTAALGDWCESQPDLVPYRGQCLIHRSELMRLHGDWPAALAEATAAAQRLGEPLHPAVGAAHYQQAELHRLRGDRHAAEDAYRRAIDSGHGAQPGLALLRLSQGRVTAAAATVERALSEPHVPAERAKLLAARTEIALAGGDVATARGAADDLATLAVELGSPLVLTAMSSDATAAVLLAEGDAQAALSAARHACLGWRDVEAPYEEARSRQLIALACGRLDDTEAAAMELTAVKRVFARLGAAPDVASVEALLGYRHAPGGLTEREVEVLRLVATGSTNRAVAGKLTISDKTVARHIHNIFTKLGISSRSAATAYAYEHDLV